DYGDEGHKIYNTRQSELELDNINLLYVVLTRPVEQLYIISKKDISAKGEINAKRYSGLFINYLKQIGSWNDSQSSYSFGIAKKTSIEPLLSQNSIESPSFISTSKEEHNINIVTNSGYLWDSLQEEAIEKGNLIHNVMAHIKTMDDVDFVLNDFVNASLINNEQSMSLKQKINDIINHPELKPYFSNSDTIFNERDIISKHGVILRPDKLVINSKKEVVIIDYKSGKEDKKHIQQLQSYEDLLNEMNLIVIKKILVYANNTVFVRII